MRIRFLTRAFLVASVFVSTRALAQDGGWEAGSADGGSLPPPGYRGDGPPLHSNAERYREKAPPATGRSGNAHLITRALLGKDGQTEIAGTDFQIFSQGIGNISKVQIKTYNGSGDAQWIRNLTNNGTFVYTFPDLARGQPIQVQANIDGVDKRTDVVTVSGNVKLRPDLAVLDVAAKDKVRVGTWVNVVALVSELNGDSAASADCVLSIDDQDVDQSYGIWVDAGGMVSCAFAHKFESLGTHAIKVRVGNVDPSDWDMANNTSASKSIEVVSAGQVPLYYNASVNSTSNSYDAVNDGFYRYSDGTYSNGADWSSRTTQAYKSSRAELWGWSPYATTFPLPTVSLLQSSDGTTIDSHHFDNLAADWSWGDSTYGYGAVSRFDPATYTYFYLTTYNWGGYGWTNLDYYRYAGDVTYFSAGYQTYWYDSPWGSYSSTWSWNYDYTYAYGQLPVGAQYTIGVSVTDSAGLILAASPTITTQAYGPNSYSQPYTCWEYTWAWGAQKNCSSYSSSYSSVSGYAYGVSQ